MPGRTHSSKYSTQMTNDITMRALAVLSENPRAMTIEEICRSDMLLTNITSQKMARSLTRLCDAGLIFKTKSRHLGRMVYMSAEALEEQGFDINKVIC